MESRQIVLKNLAVRYYSVSSKIPESKAIPVIFLHGWRSEGRVWQGIMLDLSAKGFTSYALDLPGFGGSEIPRTAWGVGEYCELVDEFVQKLGLDQACIAGHSFGGRVAIKLASGEPSYLKKLILVGSHGFRDTSLLRKVKYFFAKMLKPLFALSALTPIRIKIYSLMGAGDYLATPALRGTFLRVINEDLQDRMSLVKIPVCLIWGSGDKETPASFGLRMKALMPNSRLHIISDAGHYSFLDNPGKFKNILISFLSQ